MYLVLSVFWWALPFWVFGFLGFSLCYVVILLRILGHFRGAYKKERIFLSEIQINKKGDWQEKKSSTMAPGNAWAESWYFVFCLAMLVILFRFSRVLAPPPTPSTPPPGGGPGAGDVELSFLNVLIDAVLFYANFFGGFMLILFLINNCWSCALFNANVWLTPTLFTEQDMMVLLKIWHSSRY